MGFCWSFVYIQIYDWFLNCRFLSIFYICFLSRFSKFRCKFCNRYSVVYFILLMCRFRRIFFVIQFSWLRILFIRLLILRKAFHNITFYNIIMIAIIQFPTYLYPTSRQELKKLIEENSILIWEKTYRNALNGWLVFNGSTTFSSLRTCYMLNFLIILNVNINIEYTTKYLSLTHLGSLATSGI